ncbi:dynactin subunit P25 [Cylindrobasidium torrendii FP15055 ss-10]|uniref:Dynactin subunit 5 n=1 Tax=Cylindrobasidium torrendii FP15055 ss-10 TaxID=1314674 RepID=A0A0D7BJ66_9AGAR|nr:dynactin subunit P25 [Cylindrobasidium torrendii FP15055 ss-10]
MDLNDDTPVYYSKAEFIETDTGNKVSRRATIAGPQNIILGGKTIIVSQAIIRGDLRRSGAGHTVVISLGRYCLVQEYCVLRPPYKTYRGQFNYYPMKIGNCVHIGANSIVEAASVGDHVQIGKNCVIGKFAIIKDCAKIADGTIIPPNTVVPAMAEFEGSPGRFVRDLPESRSEIVESFTKKYYSRFQMLEPARR